VKVRQRSEASEYDEMVMKTHRTGALDQLDSVRIRGPNWPGPGQLQRKVPVNRSLGFVPQAHAVPMRS
jgi:hypothetical protein